MANSDILQGSKKYRLLDSWLFLSLISPLGKLLVQILAHIESEQVLCCRGAVGTGHFQALSLFLPKLSAREQVLQGASFPSDFWDLSQNLQQLLLSLPQPVLSLPWAGPHSTSPLACSSTTVLWFIPFLVLNLIYSPCLSCLTLPLSFFFFYISSLLNCTVELGVLVWVWSESPHAEAQGGEL